VGQVCGGGRANVRVTSWDEARELWAAAAAAAGGGGGFDWTDWMRAGRLSRTRGFDAVMKSRAKTRETCP